MRLFQLINEGQNTPCVVVDVQPQYVDLTDHNQRVWMSNLMDFLNKQGEVLMFVNAEADGLTMDSVEEIKQCWSEYGYDDTKWTHTEVFDKGYGYLRSWMDMGIEEDMIIKTIREMYNQRVYDSRNLFDEDEDQQEQFGIVDDMIDDPISVNWLSLAQLKQYSGGYMMGGGRNECLREVTLMMNAFNLRYRLVNDFIYG